MIFSAAATLGIGSFVKVVAWYDNERGYSCRVADLLKFLGAYVIQKMNSFKGAA